jgi:hypothetical protein
MSYIRKTIGSNERLVLLTRLHWIYIVEGLFWFALIAGAGYALNYALEYYAGYKIGGQDIDLYLLHIDAQYTQIPFFFSLIGFAIFWLLLTKYLSTEIGLTDRRIIQKNGLFMIDIQQVELEDIRGEYVHHGLLGWLLGYGKIHFDCRFIDDVILAATRNPYRIIKAVHTARMRSDSIPTYNEKDLGIDITRIEQERLNVYKTHENMKKLGRLLKMDFNKNYNKSKG